MSETPNAILTAAIDELRLWVDDSMKDDEKATQITEPAYHYTNAGGLIGILESQEMRLSSIFHLNDPTELQHGLVEGVVSLRLSEQNAHPEFKKFVDGWRAGHTATMLRQFAIFVGSFSLHGDDLGQWRSYGDDGKGFALGIRPEFFRTTPDIPAMDNERYFVAKVVYGEAATRERQLAAVAKASEIIHRRQVLAEINDDNRAWFFKTFAAELGVRILWNSITSKHQAYEHEREIRIVVIGHRAGKKGAVKFRARGSEVIPYVSLPMHLEEKQLIDRIVIGPAASHTMNHAIEELLYNKRLFRGLEMLHRSDVPYRAG
jgi:hypothetical protein